MRPSEFSRAVSFRARVDEVERELFYILERKESRGLMLFPRQLKYYRASPTGGFDRNEFHHSKLSIHPSDERPEGNQIHRTVISRKLPKIDTYAWTDAVKRLTGFTPLYWRMTPNMGAEFAPKIDQKVVHLGDYNSSHFTLCYGVMVGSPKVNFLPWYSRRPSETDVRIRFHFIDAHDYHFVEEVFTRFRIVVLVSFLNAPSPPVSHSFFVQTFRAGSPELNSEQLLNANNAFMRGIPDEVCPYWFDSARNQLLNALVSDPITSSIGPLAHHLHFTAGPRSTTPFFKPRKE